MAIHVYALEGPEHKRIYEVRESDQAPGIDKQGSHELMCACTPYNATHPHTAE